MTSLSHPRMRNILAIMIILIGTILARLANIQLVDSKYKQLANVNVVRERVIYPQRGLIYDRNGELVVTNVPIYDLMVVPYQVKEIDTSLFCQLTNITKEEFIDRIKNASKSHLYRPSVIVKQIDKDQYAILQEFLHKFPGFYGQVRTVRKYLFNNASHVYGYIGEVDQDLLNSSDEYHLGDYIGIRGVEKSYERVLRGKLGIKYVLVDVLNREKGSFNNAALDDTAVSGSDLAVTISTVLQTYGELLMKNKIGSIVAIQPRTGEILAMVSSPNYDPNVFTGSQRGANFLKLSEDSTKPLLNRAAKGTYAPGSIFKLIMALIALEEDVIHSDYGYSCSGGYHFSGHEVKCRNHSRPSNLTKAIQYSCNTYFCHIFSRVMAQSKFDNMQFALNAWTNYLYEFGLGQSLAIDLTEESTGNVPTSSYYNTLYGKGRWKTTTILSLAIGQGELSVTPLQLANLAAMIANRGYYMSPHIVIQDEENNIGADSLIIKRTSSISPEHFNDVIEGMAKTVQSGTGWIARLEGIEVCGKTATAEDPPREDHSMFLAFAPRENPEIAIAVVVENSGYGSTWAAPIASLMIEKHLTDSISKKRVWIEQYILDAELIQ